MSEELAISLRGVSKCFKRYDRPVDRLKELLIPGKSRAQEFWALRDIDLDVPKGQTLGIVGRNGSGKSTLLQIIAGTLTPTTGTVQVNGRVSALLELGSGFNPEFTGRQNVFFNGQLLGLTKGEVEERFDEIAAFADIGDFIDQLVKTYSSGMFVRLAFAVAVHVDPEVLIVDEALAVGDGVFVHKCMARIKSFRDEGGTILFVSHDIGSVNRLSDFALWLLNGQIQETGNPIEISRIYQKYTYEEINKDLNNSSKIRVYDLDSSNNNRSSSDVDQDIKNFSDQFQKINPYTKKHYISFPKSNRLGTGRAEIIYFIIDKPTLKSISTLLPHDLISVKVKLKAFDDISSPIVGVMIYDHLRYPIGGFNSFHVLGRIEKLLNGSTFEIEFQVTWPPLCSDTYSFEPAIADGSQENHEMLDWIQTFHSVQALNPNNSVFGLLEFENVKAHYNIAKNLNIISSV